MPIRSAVPGGFTRDDFAIDYAACTVICPAARTVPIEPKGSAVLGHRCRGCPLRSRCTTASVGRVVRVGAHEEERLGARQAGRAGEFTGIYRQWRPMVERAIAWLVAADHRRVRYRGVVRNQLGLAMRVAALNLAPAHQLGPQLGGRLGAQPVEGPNTWPRQ